MPKYKIRRNVLIPNSASITSASITNLTVTNASLTNASLTGATLSGGAVAGSAQFGGTSNYANFSTAGRLTLAGTGRVKRDLYIPWTAFAAGSANTSGSSDAATAGSEMDATTLSGSIPCFGFLNTTSACKIIAVAPFPTDAATTGSVTLLADWSFAKTAASVAAIGACVYYVQGGSVLTDAGAFAGSGLVPASATNSTACVITSSSVATLRSFSASTGGMIAIRFWRDATSACENSGSEFRFLGARLRYVADNLGPASSE